MDKIKVLMVLGSTNMGGAQMFILNMLRNLDLTRFQVDFAVNFEEREGGIGDELRSLGCNIYMLPYFKVYNYRHFVNEWEHFLNKHHYDIVHGHSTNSAAVYLKVAKNKGCVTIAHCHSAGFRGNKLQQLLKSYYTKKVRNVADYWFACSDIAAEHLYGKDYQKFVNYYNIPNAINAEKYVYKEDVRNRIRAEFGISDQIFLCGHVGSFTAPKNHMFLLDVFCEVLKMKPNAQLMCCGDGNLKTQVREKAQSLGILDKIIFPGIVKNCNEYMMAMDVLIFPSLFEGFPVTVVEAEATGLPVVMSDVITDEVNLTNCIYRLSLNKSPEEWARIVCNVFSDNRGDYNKIICESKYNMRTSVKKVMSLYEEMVKNKNSYGI